MANLLDDSVTQALAAARIVGRRQSYLADNPIEGKAVLGYLKGGFRPMSVVTAMGKHLVALEDARRAGYIPPIGSAGDAAKYSVEEYSSGLYNK